MAAFEFYDIEQMLNDGVSNEELRKIVADANRFKVVQTGRLDEALFGKKTVQLSTGYPSKWIDELDAFIDINCRYTGKFQIGDTVINHNAAKGACDWFKCVIGLESKIINAWVTARHQRMYEVQIKWNRHRDVVFEHQLLPLGGYEKPWWCHNATKKSFNKLTVELSSFESAAKLLNELTYFVKSMYEYNKATLELKAPDRDLSFSIFYEKKLSFVLRGQKSNRSAVLKALVEIEQ